MSACCSHCHDPSLEDRARDAAYRRVLWVVLTVNAAMFLVEVIAGLAAGSASLQADALDFLADAANYGISLFVVGMALRYCAMAALTKGLSMGAFGLWVIGTVIWHAIMGTVPEPITMGAVGTKPETPHDLTDHACINMRLPTSGGLWSWPFAKDGRELRVRVEGPLAFNAVPLILKTALASLGLAYLPEDVVQEHVAAGRLIQVLADWSPLVTGYHLYYPNRQPSPAFALLVDALRYRP